MPDTTLASADRTLAAGVVRHATVAARGASSRVAVGAALLACAAAIGLVESAAGAWLPLPWMRLGLANAAVVVALAVAGRQTAAVVSIGRVLVVGLATGTLAGPLTAMSLAGAAASLVVMIGLAAAGRAFSVVGWSAAGSVAHVVAQFCVAAALLGSGSVLALLPATVLAALACGVAVGFVSRAIVSRLPLW